MKKILLILLPTLVYLTSGCDKMVNPDANIDDHSSAIHAWNEDFELIIGETVQIEPGDLTIKAIDITEDSRCPSSVVCIWAGRVTVQLDIDYLGMEYSVVLTKGDHGLPDTAVLNDIEVKLLSVLPYPKEPGAIEKGEYIILLTVQKTD